MYFSIVLNCLEDQGHVNPKQLLLLCVLVYLETGGVTSRTEMHVIIVCDTVDLQP